jgi:hypothetical protein
MSNLSATLPETGKQNAACLEYDSLACSLDKVASPQTRHTVKLKYGGA